MLVNDALTIAVWKRKPAKGLILHTDRGSQYVSDSHRLLLGQHGIVQSMSRKGDCWDNAVAESFFHSLKTGLVHHETYPTRVAAKQSIFEYIEVFYSRQRLLQSMVTCHRLMMNYSTKLLNRVSGKVLTHHHHHPTQENGQN